MGMPSSAHAIYVSVAVLFCFYFKRAVLMQHGECARGGRDGVVVVIFFTLSFSRLFVFCFCFSLFTICQCISLSILFSSRSFVHPVEAIRFVICCILHDRPSCCTCTLSVVQLQIH